MMRRAVGILSIAVVPVFVGFVAFAGDYMGEHAMTGRITSIDKDRGRVTVEAQGEELDLHYPQSALQNLNKGDQVTVTLGIRRMGTGSPTAGTPGSRGGDVPPTGGIDKPGVTDR